MIDIIRIGNDTTMMRRPCVTLKVNNTILNDISEIRLSESTVAPPSLVFTVAGGLSPDQIHFYHEPDLMDAYNMLRKELSSHGIKITRTLSD